MKSRLLKQAASSVWTKSWLFLFILSQSTEGRQETDCLSVILWQLVTCRLITGQHVHSCLLKMKLLLFCTRVNDSSGHWKLSFEKTPAGVKIFRNAAFSVSSVWRQSVCQWWRWSSLNPPCDEETPGTSQSGTAGGKERGEHRTLISKDSQATFSWILLTLYSSVTLRRNSAVSPHRWFSAVRSRCCCCCCYDVFPGFDFRTVEDINHHLLLRCALDSLHLRNRRRKKIHF